MRTNFCCGYELEQGMAHGPRQALQQRAPLLDLGLASPPIALEHASRQVRKQMELR
jgi:hypothetical protein